MKTWTQRTKKDRAKLKRESEEKRDLIRHLKSGPCADCGLSFPPREMGFAPIPGRPTSGTIPSMTSLERIRQETKNWAVICSGCRSIRTSIVKAKENAARVSRFEAIAEAVEAERERRRLVSEPTA